MTVRDRRERGRARAVRARRAAARARWRRCRRRSSTALADAGVPMTELPLTPERVWRRIQELKKEGTWQSSETCSGDRHRDDGPGDGRGAGPRPGSRRRSTTSAPRRSSGRRRGVRAGRAACSSGSRRRRTDGGSLRFESDLGAGARGRGLRARGGAGEARAEARGLPQFEQHVGRRRDPRLEHLRASRSRRSPTRLRASRARRRHALVEPAAPDPDDRGDPGRADLAARRSTRPASSCAAIGYHPVVEKEVPGFVENRILYAILRECLDLVDRGIIDPEGLDLNVRWGIGYKLAVIGPMELLDMAGLDIYHAVGSYLNQDLSHLRRGLVDDPRPDRQGPARHEDGRRHLRLHA